MPQIKGALRPNPVPTKENKFAWYIQDWTRCGRNWRRIFLKRNIALRLGRPLRIPRDSTGIPLAIKSSPRGPVSLGETTIGANEAL
jgi:hypothetical protein